MISNEDDAPFTFTIPKTAFFHAQKLCPNKLDATKVSDIAQPANCSELAKYPPPFD